MLRKGVLAFALLFAYAIPVGAGQITSWDALGASGQATIGNTVYVTDSTGRRVKGRIQDLSDASLVLLTSDSGARTFDETSVRRIQRSDSVVNGLLIGLGAGIAGAVIARRSICSLPDPECEVIVNLAVGVPMVVGGTVAGGITDMLIKKTIYTAPPRPRSRFDVSPIAGRARRGLALSVSF